MKRTAAITKRAREAYMLDALEAPNDQWPPWDRLAPHTQEQYIAAVHDQLKSSAMAVKLPTVREETPSEAHRAYWWRSRVMKLKMDELAKLTGYTAQAIYLMERGVNSSGKRVAPWVWQRYKMTCHAVHAQLRGWEPGTVFDWQEPK